MATADKNGAGLPPIRHITEALYQAVDERLRWAKEAALSAEEILNSIPDPAVTNGARAAKVDALGHLDTFHGAILKARRALAEQHGHAPEHLDHEGQA